MRRASRGAATVRAVVVSVVLSLALAGAAAWWVRARVIEGERAPAVTVPVKVEAAPIPPPPAPAPPDPGRDPVELAWCERGPAAVIELTVEMTQAGFDPASSPQVMRHAWLRCEAMFTLGRVQDALDWSRRMVESLQRTTPAQSLEPLVLEQHARVRMAAGESNMLKLETGLKASIEARGMLGGEAPDLAWATLGALQKARGDCAAAVESDARGLAGLDAPAWLRMRQREPWRLQVLALVAMDRADCLSGLGRAADARAAAAALASDLAVALGDDDPLSQQAADLRDSLGRGQ
jgi:hypothetical protein